MLETRTRVAAPAAAIPGWRFWVPLAVQVLIVLAVPAPKLAAYAAGTPVVLRTVPVDPVDLMRGRYAQLGYEIGREAVKRLPDGPVYVTLAPGQPAWRAVAFDQAWPASVPAGDVVLAGKREGGAIKFGLEEYYVPEHEGDRLANALAAHREGNLARIKVDGRGTAVLTGFEVGEARF